MKNKSAGYFQHERALVEKKVSIGKGTRIWAFAHVLTGTVIGQDCNICDHVFIEGGVRIGDRVTVKCGVSLWDGVMVDNDVFIGPNAVFTNDLRPRSQSHPDVYARTYLKEGCSLGANCTVLPGVAIGRWAMIGAGAVVTRSVPDYGLVVGVPARLKSWVCRCGNKLDLLEKPRTGCSCGRQYERKTGHEVHEVIRTPYKKPEHISRPGISV